ncbi:hypothetical protein LJB71_08640 [Thermomonas sp. S9]|uniref:hypothetical protein n=1 Tax=Thermomonas sp. S9 TaxID=2885203 RepID=UPI00216B20C9|nr:hypothetical protein [Thermomonas sp. S9]MCR6496278.1 hypothetical protein [Thermomonas sp. S9]
MHTTTPGEISRPIKRLIEKVVPGGNGIYLPVNPEAGAVVNECFPNVQAKLERDGGQMLCGWQVWEWPHVLVEAEFHAVWKSPAGALVDITPKAQNETHILFVPDPRLSYQGLAKDNVRVPPQGRPGDSPLHPRVGADCAGHEQGRAHIPVRTR